MLSTSVIVHYVCQDQLTASTFLDVLVLIVAVPFLPSNQDLRRTCTPAVSVASVLLVLLHTTPHAHHYPERLR
jgi:hypothetical protein